MIRFRGCSRLLPAAPLLLFLAGSLPASAQTQTASQTASVDDVIVTAQRRSESSQKVALALTVVSGETLDDRNIQTVNDLENTVPSLEVDSQLGGGQPQFRIRGIGFQDYGANNASPVGVYVDEVGFAFPVQTQGLLFDLERVEVLRGPQGTLFGRNTTGGAINFITKAPSLHGNEGYAEAGYGNFNTFTAQAAVEATMPFDPIPASVRPRCRA